MKYTIKNFRVFDKDGVTLDMRPMTILTGCNSSGKSSVVKSMVLLDSFFNSLRKDADMGLPLNLSEYKLDFSCRPNNMLGNFSRIINRDSELAEITYEYTIHSHMIGEDIRVCLVFAREENDDLQNGYLKELSFFKEGDKLIYKSHRENGEKGDLSLLMPNFLRYAYGDYLVQLVRNIEAEECVGELSADEMKEYEDTFIAFREQFKTEYGRDAIKDIIWCWHNNNNHSCLVRKFIPDCPSLLDKCSESSSLFYIPLLEDLSTSSTEGFVKKMKNIVRGDSQEDAFNAILDRISVDYVNSGSNTFFEYFKTKEKEFLKFGFESNNFMRLFVSTDNPIYSPCVFDKKFLTLQQQNLMHFAPIIGLFEKDSFEYVAKTEKEQIAEVSEKIGQIENLEVTFDLLYEVLMHLNTKNYKERESSYWRYTNDMGFERYDHHMLSMFKEFVKNALEQILVYEFPQQISYISSSVVEIKRLYSLESNDEFSSLIKRYLEAKRKFQNRDERTKNDFTPGTFINKWVKVFEIGHSISIRVDEEGLGVTLRLHKDENDADGTFLSEQGYGITQLFVLLLRIETAILEAKSVKVANDPYYMGNFGRNESIFVNSPSTIAIEEPEVHLHPKFQSMLADLFVEAYKKYNIHFIIETHSEYLIRKTQIITSEQRYESQEELNEKNPFCVYYVTKESQMYDMCYRTNGMFIEKFGEGFMDEASKMHMMLLKNDRR